MINTLPSGTITFLFTDIEGSTPLWESQPEAMRQALARHNAVLRQAVEAEHGQIFKIIGDAFQAAFARPAEAARAAVAAQHSLQAAEWGALGPLRVRMGLHVGPAEWQDGDYAVSHTLNRVARIMSAAHGGQIVLSAEMADLTQGDLPAGVSLRDLGQHRMKGMARREHLFQLDAQDLPGEFPSLATLDSIPNNLPVQLTSFIGRELELAEVEGLLTPTPALSRHPGTSSERGSSRSGEGKGPGVRVRLLTLTGSGGTGKTRLSLQAAEQSMPAFPDGAWLVELAPLADPAQVLPALAGVLGLQELPGQTLWVIVSNYLRAKTSLLVLDNCEHLVEACARLAEDLLRACPRVKILASSREALGVPGETAYRVPSLSLPQGDDVTRCESARLFIARAQAALARFAVTPANAPALAQICRRLDGIPLALELAAARVKALSLEQIAARLDDRFQLLTGGSRTALPRQQTLRALIDWSYSLLSEPERLLCRRLAVFAGGWTLEAAEAVCGDKDEGWALRVKDEKTPDVLLHPSDVLDLLTHLVDKSLVVMDERAGEARYYQLETIRQYAREKLFEAPASDAPLPSQGTGAAALRDRHLAYFVQVAERAEPHLRGPAPLDWQNRLDADYDNLRAAVEWGQDRDPEAVLRLGGALHYFWTYRYHFEARAWLEIALARVQALPPVAGQAGLARARAMAYGCLAVGILASSQGDAAGRLDGLARAVAAAGESADDRVLCMALTMHANYLSNALDVAGTRAAAERGLALARKLNEPTMTLMNLVVLGWAMGTSGDQAAQQAMLAEVSRLRPQAHGYWLIGPFLFLGRDARGRGDLAHAREHIQEVIRLTRLLGVTAVENIGLSELAHVDRQAGDFAAARAGYARAILVWKDLGNRGAVANLLECFGFIASAEAQPERGARLLGAAEALRELAGAPMLGYERAGHEREVAALRTALEPARLNEAWTAGRLLTLDQAVAFALHET